MESKHNNPAGRNWGKGVSHRLQEIDDKFKKSGGIFKEYKIGELFEVKNNPQLNKEYFIFSDKGEYPYFTRTVANNGILGYVEYLNEKNKITGNSIAVGMLGMQFFYMEKDFYAGQFTKTIYPKFKYFNEKIALYFTSLFNLHSKRYQGVLVRNFEHTFLKTIINLPTLNNELAFEYMEERIRELESERIRELEAYLQATGLNNYILDENDRGGVNRLIENKIELKEYKAGELFTVKSSKKKFNANNINITNDYNLHPYVARGSSNNGIKGYISENIEFLNDENTLAFGQDTATCFYQDKPYFTGDKIKILSPINFTLNSHIGLYIISSMKKTLKHLSWGQNSFNEDFIKNIKIKLPIKNNNIDFNYIEQLIKTLEKIIIKDVVEYKDKIIQTHKNICKQ